MLLFTPRGRRTLVVAITDIGHVLGIGKRHPRVGPFRPTLSDVIALRYADGTLTLDGIDRFVEYLDRSGDLDELDEPPTFSATPNFWSSFNAPPPVAPPVTVASADRRLREAFAQRSYEIAEATTVSVGPGGGGGHGGTGSVTATATFVPPYVYEPNVEVVELVAANGDPLSYIAKAKTKVWL